MHPLTLTHWVRTSPKGGNDRGGGHVIRHDVPNDYHGDPHRVQNQARPSQIFPILHHIFIMVAGVEIHTKVAQQAQSEILTDGALEFLAAIHRTFESTRQSLLDARHDAQRRFDSGVPLDFFPETAAVRNEPSWACAPPGPGLEDRRVEITGPPDRKMIINALNSGAKTFMADFEGKYSLV
ncbi:hypothetical protein PILCRDRAFT_439111 [Piloderma croceum F 1598]|uniref:Malate synthase N-terminal domain-containing protein n=1 Tax=Piloderma croceum (strain F 1598) TaxID=765440 RepID=A0A0C3BAG5_PILCF|nr:hypothetical protein PILCRDRAFT_439111 [Piloderma croceum F 1598]